MHRSNWWTWIKQPQYFTTKRYTILFTQFGKFVFPNIMNFIVYQDGIKIPSSEAWISIRISVLEFYQSKKPQPINGGGLLNII